MFIRAAYSFDADGNSMMHGIADTGESLTHQSFKDECDINRILRDFSVTGRLPDNVRVPSYGDFSEAMDFKACMNVIREAEESFAAMPSDVRERFANDPGKFLAFVHDEKNYDEAVKLGISVRPPAPPPGPVEGPGGPVGPSSGGGDGAVAPGA